MVDRRRQISAFQPELRLKAAKVITLYGESFTPGQLIPASLPRATASTLWVAGKLVYASLKDIETQEPHRPLEFQNFPPQLKPTAGEGDTSQTPAPGDKDPPPAGTGDQPIHAMKHVGRGAYDVTGPMTTKPIRAASKDEAEAYVKDLDAQYRQNHPDKPTDGANPTPDPADADKTDATGETQAG